MSPSAEKLYDECLELAKESGCKKMGFGAILVDMNEEKIIARSNNSPIGPLQYLCETECIRNQIPSRTESMVGACAHAEERCLWAAAQTGVDLSRCELYIMGVRADGESLVKEGLEFTCIRCATHMYLSGVRGVNVWYQEAWHLIPSEIALEQATPYALQAKELRTQK